MTEGRSQWGSSAAVTGALIASLWLLFTGSFHRDELLIGLPVWIASLLFVHFVRRTEFPSLAPRWADVLVCWRLPWDVLKGMYAILRVLARDLAGQPAPSFFFFCGFQTSTRDPHLVARGVLATAYMTTTPTSIVLGIDASQSRILFHQIDRSGVSAMAKQLGARVTTERE